MKKIMIVLICSLFSLPVYALDDLMFKATVGLMYSIKQNLRDPESVVWEEVLASPGRKTICVRYRARNGFNGMTRSVFIVAGEKASEKVAFWNQHCLTGMDDYIAAKHALR